MGLPASYLLVTVAFCAVLHYDAQFRQDLFDGIKGMQGRWFHVLLAGFAMYSMYTKITRHLRMERLKGGVGLRLRVNKKLGWVVVEVIPGGAGDVGGVKRGDIIVAVGESSVHSFSTVRVIRGPVGSEVTLKLVRGCSEANIEIQKDEEAQRRKAAGEQVAADDIEQEVVPVDFETSSEYVGLELVELTLTRKETPLVTNKSKSTTAAAAASPPQHSLTSSAPPSEENARATVEAKKRV